MRRQTEGNLCGISNMKYVVLKNSLNYLCVKLPEGFGKGMEIICFETQEEFAEFLKNEQIAECPICLPPSDGNIEQQQCLPEQDYDGLFIRQNEYFKKILFSDIMWVEASRSYSYIHTSDNQRIILTYPLAEVKKKVPPEQFVQPHRSFLLNVNYVNKYIGNILYIDKQSFPISRKFKKETLNRFLFLDNIKETLERNKESPEDSTDETENYQNEINY